MSASTTTMRSSTSVYTAPAFCERLWRTAGFIVGYTYGNQPQVGASPDALTAFYGGSGARILIAAVFYRLAVLNLMWFSAAVRTTLADAGYDGWGAAATASSTVLGGLFFLLVAVVAVVAYSIAGSGNHALTSGLNDFVWAGFVLTSFPRAMLIMSSAFGLWRAGQISNALFAAGVAAVARLTRRHHLAERWALRTRRSLFAFRLARHRRGVGDGRERGAPSSKPCYPCCMVKRSLARPQENNNGSQIKAD